VEMLQLLKYLARRTDDLESQLQQQAARTMRDRKAVLSALEVQGAAVNTIASRLGATTSQAVVKAFKSCENMAAAAKAASEHEQRSKAAAAAPTPDRSSAADRSSTASGSSKRASFGAASSSTLHGGRDPHEA
jgi:hypothetical protein